MEFSKIKLQMIKEQSFKYNEETIKNATDIVKIINNIEELEKATEENVYIICLNIKNNIIAYSQIAKGGIENCNVDLKTIFKTVLLSNSSKFILIHNHPTGNPQASKYDYEITKQIKKASEIMHMQFLDHIIIAGNNYISCMK